MKLTFLVNYDSAAALALNYLLPKLNQHTVRVLYTNKATGPSTAPTALACLKNFDAKLIANSRKLKSFKDLGAIEANDVNRQDFDLLQSTRPDLIVSIRHMTILHPAAINLPKHGVINLHSGLLPDYQGVMASFWAMLNQEPDLGTTLHWIEDSNIDAGETIAHSSNPTNYKKSYLWNVLNIYRGGCENVLAAINAIAGGQNVESQKQAGGETYYSFPTQADIDRADFRLFSSVDTVDAFLT